MKVAVVDTSALIRLYIPDGPIAESLEDYVELAWRSEAILIAPELSLVEVGQVLLRKERDKFITLKERQEILDAILNLPMERVGHRLFIEAAIEIASKKNLSVYDAMFFAVAKAHTATLISSDDRLMAAWGK